MFSKIHLVPQTAPDHIRDGDLRSDNDAIAYMVATCLKYLKILPTSDEQKKMEAYCKKSEENSQRMLLFNLFYGCAMTYQGCETSSFEEMDGKKSTIVGQPCIKYFTGSMAEGVGCANPKEYSDSDIMNILQTYKALDQRHADMSDALVENKLVSNHTNSNQAHEENKTKTDDKTCSTDMERKDIKNKDILCVKSVVDINNEASKLTTEQNDTELLAFKVIHTNEGSYPGYVSLINSHECDKLQKLTATLNYRPVIRSTTPEQLLAHEFEFDNAIAVECCEWPKEALLWKSRARPSGWPGKDLISKCMAVPCYIVSKSHALNPDDRFEWRYSFARHETILLRSLPIETRMVYIISKILLKHVTIKDNVLTTYHLKTLFLWYCEVKSPDLFVADELDKNVEQFLQFVSEHVSSQKILNYFINSNNMVAHIPESDMSEVKLRVNQLVGGINEVLHSIRTAKRFPFSFRSILAGKEKSSPNMLKINSNFLFAIIEQMFDFHLPNSHIMWNYVEHTPHMVEQLKSTVEDEDPKIALQWTANVLKESKRMYEIYGETFVELSILYCFLRDINQPQFSFMSKPLLSSVIQLLTDNTAIANCMVKAVSLIGLRLGVIAAEQCCITMREWTIKQGTGKSVFMFTIKRVLNMLGSMRTEDECKAEHLMSSIQVVSNALEVSKKDMEVGLAVFLRMSSSPRDLGKIHLLTETIKEADLNGVLKHLVYGLVLFLEEKSEVTTLPRQTDEDQNKSGITTDSIGDKLDRKQEAKKLQDAIYSLCCSNILPTGVDTFCLVTAAVVFQKLTLDKQELSVVNMFLDFLEMSKLSKQLAEMAELVTNIKELVKTGETEISDVFQFIVYYIKKSILTTGLTFVLSVLDELLQPHYNLGVLSAAGLELTATSLDDSIATIETWIARATGAPIQQNPLLIVKMYGNLGHLYHLKSQCIGDQGKHKVMLDKSMIMFKTALKETPVDLSVTLNYILLLKRANIADYEIVLEQVCSETDPSTISNYFESAVPLFKGLTEIQNEILSAGHMRVSSLVLAHFLAISWKQSCPRVFETQVQRAKLQHHLDKIAKTLRDLSCILPESEVSSATKSMEKDVLINSYLLLGFAAESLNTDIVALNAFNSILKFEPDHQTALTHKEELSSKTFTAQTEALYVRK